MLGVLTAQWMIAGMKTPSGTVVIVLLQDQVIWSAPIPSSDQPTHLARCCKGFCGLSSNSS